MLRLTRIIATTSLFAALSAMSGGARAQQPAPAMTPAVQRTTGAAASLALADIEPPPPTPPSVISRDDQGHATMRAFRLEQPLTIDGRLDERVYATTPGAAGFIQQEPHEGEHATEDTDVWVFFDDSNIYIAARCWEDHPERWIVTELQRDGDIINNESVSVMFDTFRDRRNGFFFQTSPAGTLRDQTFTDEGNSNISWNAVWRVKAARFDRGWSLEMAIPFKSLRYPAAGPQVWGINFRRVVRWRNETSYLTRVPAEYGGSSPFHASVFGTLVGLETPAASKNLELKPYVASSLTTDRTAAVPFSNDLSGNVGADVKYGLTKSITADATINTDFAQVEEDVQQINLTRFNLLFPEKRDFFLEGQGLFAFGGAQVNRGGGGSDVPILFFSRQIGLSHRQSVPVIAGGRVTGKAGKYSVGLLSIETNDKPEADAVETNFSVVRLKRDILRKSSVGVLATLRNPRGVGADANTELGVDANLAFFRSLSIAAYYARTHTPGLAGDHASYRGKFDYEADRYGLLLERLQVGDGFDPELGYTQRIDFRRSSIQARFSPRPKSSRLIRKLTWQAGLDYITDGKGQVLQNKETQASFDIGFNNSDSWSIDYTRDFEFLPETFTIAPNVVLPVGEYRYQSVGSSYRLGQQHRVSGNVSVSRGTFYGGNRTAVGYSSGRVSISPHLMFEPGVTLNWVNLPQGDFTSRLITNRVLITPTPRMAVTSLLQFNASAHTLSSSVRLRWEYIPGSELFIVYSDGRDTESPGIPDLQNRTFAIKLTRLVRF